MWEWKRNAGDQGKSARIHDKAMSRRKRQAQRRRRKTRQAMVEEERGKGNPGQWRQWQSGNQWKGESRQARTVEKGKTCPPAHASTTAIPRRVSCVVVLSPLKDYSLAGPLPDRLPGARRRRTSTGCSFPLLSVSSVSLNRSFRPVRASVIADRPEQQNRPRTKARTPPLNTTILELGSPAAGNGF